MKLLLNVCVCVCINSLGIIFMPSVGAESGISEYNNSSDNIKLNFPIKGKERGVITDVIPPRHFA